MKDEKLDLEDVLKKKQYVQICSIKLQNSNHKYEELAAILNVRLINIY